MAQELTPEQVRALVEKGEAQVVDVRTDEEREAAHIPGTRHIPLERLEEEAAGLDRERPLVLYCRSGDRSAMAAEAFSASGWDATSLQGGILAWHEGGLAVEPEDGEIVTPSGLPPK